MYPVMIPSSSPATPNWFLSLTFYAVQLVTWIVCWSLVSWPRLLLAYPRYGLYIAEEWQKKGVPSGQLKSSKFTFEPGPNGLVSRAGLGQSRALSQACIQAQSPQLCSPPPTSLALSSIPGSTSRLLCSRIRYLLGPEKHPNIGTCHLWSSHDLFLLYPPFVVP